ncbi:MAG: formate dehydrogenase accessory sulfurtransferase FdhD [Bacteroidota bacterium]
MQPSVDTGQILKFNDGEWERVPDLLASEEPMEIRLELGDEKNRTMKSLAVTMRTPGNDFELAIGFLFTEGIIKGYSDILHVRHCTDGGKKEEVENIVIVSLRPGIDPHIDSVSRNFYTTSSCGICGKSSIDSVKVHCNPILGNDDWKVSSETLISLPDSLRTQQQVFAYTGGIHACALFSLEGSLKLLREDVGRHNALDKLIGACVASDRIPIGRSILLLSGRASFELLQKAAMAGIRFVAAVGAPSGLAVKIAKEFDITLLGFVRNRRFNVYHGEHRIIQ